LGLAQQQITKAIDTVTQLQRAISAFSKGDMIKTNRFLENLFLQEVEVDNLRRSVFKELTKGSLPLKYREDLMSLVKRLDRLADYVKDSARSVKILTEVKVPKKFWDPIVDIAEKMVECSIVLGDCIETLGYNPRKAKELANKIDVTEEQIDDKYLEIKALFIKHSKDVDVAILMELRELIDYMEKAADICADTADYIRVLAAGE